ncbi:phage portal protein, partial [Levilactobacillus namurensis]|uniref:phage portal protein n=1 Tax=Levilactobacillus namurensis TaxID=380393 RepID=UPI00222E7317
TDQNFAANASGVAMAYKLWGSDQEMDMSETLYQRGIRRRLRLLMTYWRYLKNNDVTITAENNPADNVTIAFTP